MEFELLACLLISVICNLFLLCKVSLLKNRIWEIHDAWAKSARLNADIEVARILKENKK